MNTKVKSFYLNSFESNHDIIALTETWLKDKPEKKIYNSELMCNKFQIFRRDRTEINGGGVLIAISTILPSEEIIPSGVENIEFVAACIKLNNKRIFVTCSYISPSSSLQTYNLHLKAIQFIAEQCGNLDSIIVLGDFNLPHLTWRKSLDGNFLVPSNTSESSISFVDSVAEMGLFQLNDVPNSLGRMLDLVFVDDPDTCSLVRCDPLLLPEDVYHPCLEITMSIKLHCTVRRDYVNEFVFNFKRADFKKLNYILTNENWFDFGSGNIIDSSEIDKILEKFYYGLYNCFRRSVPMVKIKNRNGPPWNTNQLARLKNLKNKYYKKYKRTGINSDYAQYSIYRSAYNLLNMQLYNNYLVKVRNNFKSNARTFYQFVNSKRRVFGFPSMMKYGEAESYNDQEICDMFADFFLSSYSTRKWDSLNGYQYHISEYTPITYPKLHPSTVLKAILKLKNSTSYGPDGVPSCVLLNCSQSLLLPLTYLFNLSLSSGYFPNLWKTSFIIPLFKSGSRSNISNYRGIAKLSIIPKLFEQILTDILSHQVSSFLSPSQHGFRKGHSTTTNLLEFSSKVINSFTKGMQTDAIYTDFSKAFDKVNHDLLLHKLNIIGFCNNFINWISSYLKYRTQRIVFKNHKSKIISVRSGVPQGSHLGPLLFLLFINDMPSCIKYCDMLMYADDVKVFLHFNHPDSSRFLQEDLEHFYHWCNSNLMELNLKKCKHMHFYRGCPIRNSYNINTHSLDKVEEILDLGVLLDAKLTFNSHISQSVNKAKSVLGFIKRWGKEFNDPYVLKQLFTSLVRPILEFASVVWDPHYDIHISRIESVQKQFLLFCLRHLQWRPDTALPSYKSRLALIKLPTLKSRRTLMNISFVNNLINGLIESEFLISKLEFIVPSRPTRHFVPLKLPYFRTNFANFDPIRRICVDYNNHFHLMDYSLDAQSFRKRIIFLLNS